MNTSAVSASPNAVAASMAARLVFPKLEKPVATADFAGEPIEEFMQLEKLHSFDVPGSLIDLTVHRFAGLLL